MLTLLKRLRYGMRALLGRRRAERDLDDELRLHLELETERHERAGMMPQEARRRARVAFGAQERFREESRDARGTRWLEEAWQDGRYGLRAMRRTPAFTAVVVVTIAIGIAGSTTVFSVLNPYLVRELPFHDATRLVQIGQIDPVTGWDGARFSPAMIDDWRARTRAFDELGAYYYGPRNLTDDGGAERIYVSFVSGSMFGVLGAAPALGRTIEPEDAGPAGRSVVVLSHALWQGRYGADSAILGRTIRIDGAAHTVIGVMSPAFNFPWNEIRLWLPIRLDPATTARDATSSILVGRLAAGWTAEAAREELTGIQRELGAVHPDIDGGYAGVSVKPLREALNFMWPIVSAGLIVLLAAVTALLLIACMNVATLSLARATTRSREVGVRLALGASRVRVARQLMTENLLLGLIGGTLGLLLTWAAVHGIGPALPEGLYRVGTATIDASVLLYALVLTLATPLVFGLAPAIGSVRRDVNGVLKEGSRAGAGRGALRARRALVVAQLALAAMIITSAGLMVRSYMTVARIDLGFDADRLLVVEISAPVQSYAEPAAVAAYFDRVLAEVSAIPGARTAASVNPLPLNHELYSTQFAPPDESLDSRHWPLAYTASVSVGYFDAMRIPLLAGRTFAGDADAGAVVISRRLAEQQWPGEDPIGRALTLGADARERVTVIGVVGDIRHDGLVGDVTPHVYMPAGSGRRRFIVLPAAGTTDPVALTRAVQQEVARVDANVPATIRPMRDIVRENGFQWTISSLALSVFGLIALLLAALGLYAVIAYSVAERRHELAIRLAIGARAHHIRSLVLGDGLRLTALGVIVGLVLALAASRALASQLVGVDAFDPVTIGCVLLVFAAVGTVTTVRLASRAAATPPHDALRNG
ncbi:MAG TPA: ABC transporter permease [Longimicrobiales bacterium]|nr:ABC transporter permease [Longimicrobiales bacterium]